MSEEPATEEAPPKKRTGLARLSLLCGLGAIALPSFFPVRWELCLVVGFFAAVAGFFAVKRAGKSPENRTTRLMARGGLLLGGVAMAAGMFRAPTANLNSCRVVSDLTAVTALESAINCFLIEYETLPNVGHDVVTTDSPEGVKLMKILMRMEDASSSHQNIRDIKFLSVREAKNRKNGLQYSVDEKSVEGLFDAYGNGYTVVINRNPEEPLRVPFGKRTVELKGRDCAVFSLGEDGIPGTEDDVLSW